MKTIAFLDIFPPATFAQLQAQVPENFVLRAVTTWDDAEKLAIVSDADFILTGAAPVTAQVINAAPRLLMIQKWGTGYDRIDIRAAAARRVIVAVTTGANAASVAEHTLMLMLAVYRRLPYLDSRIRQGFWAKSDIPATLYQLGSKRIGLVGLGHSGRAVAQLLQGFDARIAYYKRSRDVEAERRLNVDFSALDDLLAESDVVSLHVPLSEETRALIDDRALTLMKPTAILINTSRGAVVDENALLEALKSGRLLGAGLDVFATEPPLSGNPLYSLPNVVLTNHCAGNAIESAANIARHAFSNMRKVAAGSPLEIADIVQL